MLRKRSVGGTRSRPALPLRCRFPLLSRLAARAGLLNFAKDLFGAANQRNILNERAYARAARCGDYSARRPVAGRFRRPCCYFVV